MVAEAHHPVAGAPPALATARPRRGHGLLGRGLRHDRGLRHGNGLRRGDGLRLRPGLPAPRPIAPSSFAPSRFASSRFAPSPFATTPAALVRGCGGRILQGGAGRNSRHRALHHRNGLADQLLDLGEVFLVRRQAEGDGPPGPPGAPGPSDAVDVILGMDRHVEVEDVAHARDVEAPGGDVRCDQELQLAITELAEDLHPELLVEVAVQGGGVEAVALQRLCHHVNVPLAVAEDDAVGERVALGPDQPAQEVALLGVGAILARGRVAAQELADGLGGRRLPRHLDPHRIVQEFLRDPGDLGGHGGGEEQRLPGEGHQLEDALDVGDEAHVEHAVGLVDDHDLHAGQHELAALEMVEQPARRRDQHVDAAVDELVLVLEADAADQERHRELHMLRVFLEILGDLRGQFARGAEHEAARHAGPGTALGQMRDHRQGEGGGLAGPGLGDAEDVAAFQRMGNGLGLDRGGAEIARLGHGLKDPRVQREICESCHESCVVVGRCSGRWRRTRPRGPGLAPFILRRNIAPFRTQSQLAAEMTAVAAFSRPCRGPECFADRPSSGPDNLAKRGLSRPVPSLHDPGYARRGHRADRRCTGRPPPGCGPTASCPAAPFPAPDAPATGHRGPLP